MPSAAPVVLPSVSPEVSPPKADATWAAVMAAVAVKVSPLRVALWPAPNAAKVMVEIVWPGAVEAAMVSVMVAASVAVKVTTPAELVPDAQSEENVLE